jgi:hypothetical protein
MKIEKINYTYLKNKYPNLKTDFDYNWRNIIKKCLTDQYHRNPKSTRLTKVKQSCRHIFGYITDENELDIIQDRISDKFITCIYESDWDHWRNKLANLFSAREAKNLQDTDTITNSLETYIKLDENGVPNSISSIPVSKQKTYTIRVYENGPDEDVIFNSKTVPAEVAMTTISQIASALA